MLLIIFLTHIFLIVIIHFFLNILTKTKIIDNSPDEILRDLYKKNLAIPDLNNLINTALTNNNENLLIALFEYFEDKPELDSNYLKKNWGKSTKSPNTLTIYHDTVCGLAHGFVKLECIECSNGMPAILTVGFYPATYDDKKADPNLEKYELAIEHTSFIMNSLNHFKKTSPYNANIAHIYNKSFNISSESAVKVLERIKTLANFCDKDYQYKSFGNNCLDFVQHIYKYIQFSWTSR